MNKSIGYVIRKVVAGIFLILIATLVSFGQTNPNHVKVKGYYKANGTYVQPHYRTAPNSTNRDNFSTLGNTNPYTSEKGYVVPDNKVNPYSYSTQSSSENELKKANVEWYTSERFMMREGKSLDSKFLEVLPSNAKVRVLSSNLSDNYLFIQYANKTGFVPKSSLNSRRLKSNESSPNSYPTSYAEAKRRKISGLEFYTSVWVNMRESMDQKSNFVIKIPPNTKVKVLSKNLSDDYLFVFYQGKTGFVDGSFLELR